MKYYDVFGEPGYHSAFLTTYAFSAQAFEGSAFPRLRGTGCRNITVLADESMVNLSLGEFGTPRFAGSLYHLIKVAVRGAFHPKITLLLGETKGRLLVGSANLTALGLAGNRELIADLAYSPDAPALAPLLKGAFDYISSCAPPGDQWFPAAHDRALQLSSWLPENSNQTGRIGTEDLSLITDQFADGVLDQIVAAIGNDEIAHLIIMSPYWDSRLEALRRLREALGMPPTDLLIEKSRGEFPGPSFSCNSGMEIFDIEDGGRGRFNHSKLLVARGLEWDHVFSGSVNCTMPALLGNEISHGNAEAGIYKRVPRGTALPALGLDHYRRVPIDPVSLVEQVRSTELDETPFADPGSFRLRGNRISWLPPRQLREVPTHVTVLDSQGENPFGSLAVAGVQETSWTVDLELGRPRSACLNFAGGTVSAPGFVIDLDLLAQSTLPSRGSKKDKLADRLAAAGHEDLDLVGILTELEAIDVVEATTRLTRLTGGPGKGDCPDEARQNRTLTYEDFVAARNRADAARGAGNSIASSGGRRAADLVSSCLNRLIGLVSRDLSADEEAELQKAASLNLSVTEPTAISTEQGDGGRAGVIRPPKTLPIGPRRKEHAAKILQVVAAFETRAKSLRGTRITTAELVRLRSLLQITLAYAQPLGMSGDLHGILPVTDKAGHDWPRLAGRLLLQHFGKILALHDLQLDEAELENERLRILEYLATAYFASQAATQVVEARSREDALKKPLDTLQSGIVKQVDLAFAIDPENRPYFWQLVAKLDKRFSALLGITSVQEKAFSNPGQPSINR